MRWERGEGFEQRGRDGEGVWRFRDAMCEIWVERHADANTMIVAGPWMYWTRCVYEDEQGRGH